MATAAASGAYLPVHQEGHLTTAPNNGSQSSLKGEEKKKDPIYAAMFGTQIGSSTALPSNSRTRLDSIGIDTLDEPVIETLVLKTP